jgi:hypothetical protein
MSDWRSVVSSFGLLITGITLAILGYFAWNSFYGFGAQRISDYSEGEPITADSLAQVLDGNFTAHGVIYNYTGRVISRFTAKIEGKFNGDNGELNESFTYASGAIDRRQWAIQITDNGKKFAATADDVIGVGIGELGGDAIRMSYSIKLPERAGGHVLNVNDWLYVMPDGSIVNRSEMRKFGIKVAELMAVFVRTDQTSAVQIAAE